MVERGGRGVRCVAPIEVEEVSLNKDLCFKRLFNNTDDLNKIFKEFGSLACDLEYFD